MIVVVMGVCGSGKTTVGKCLAEKLDWQFSDADEFHTDENKAKMSSGQALTDQDRLPWLQSIHNYMKRLSQNSQSGVVTCSALRKVYRDILREGDSPVLHKKDKLAIANNSGTLDTLSNEDQNINCCNENVVNDEKGKLEFGIHFVHLTGSKAVLETRMVHRLGHFMPALLLESQLDTLEDLEDMEIGFAVDIDKSVDGIIEEITGRLCIK